MRPSKMQLFFLSTFILFSALSHGRKISFDDLNGAALVKGDNVQRTFAKSLLLEKHSDSIKKEWKLQFISLENKDIPHIQSANSEIVLSSQVLESFRKLSGLAKLPADALNEYTVSPDTSRLLFHCANDLFIFSREHGTTERLTSSEIKKEEFQFSPDGQLVAYLQEYNIWVVDVKTKQARKLTFDGNENLLHGKLDWVYQEEIFGRGSFRGFWWSPDSQNIAFLRIDESPVKKFPLVDDSADYGNLRFLSYPKAGTNNPEADIGVIKVSDGEIAWVDLSSYASPLIVGLGFNKDSSQLLYQVQNRTQSSLHLGSYDLSNRQSAIIWSENSSTWVNRLQESYIFTDNGFYFLSELSGYAQIYFYSYEEQSAHQKTHENFEVKKIIHTSDDYLYLVANEKSLLEDQVYSLNLFDGKITRLLSADQHHEAEISANGLFMMATSQSHLRPPEKKLYSLSGSTVTPISSLFRADISGLENLDLQNKQYFTIENRRGQKMQSLLFWPTDFDANKKYPLMTHVYCGPKNPIVKNRFSVSHELWHHYLAQEGYIVLMLDCHSANSIGHEGESIVHKNLGHSELEDIEDGINYLKQQSWIDSQRIGLWGWSFGGFMTSYAMTRTEIFKAGIAIAPVTDWALYDTIYTERYMCSPKDNPEGYRCSSILERAAELKGELLLVHGAMDDNVHKQNSLQFAHKVQESGNTSLHQVLYLQNDHGLLGVRKHLFAMMARFIKANL